MSENLNDKLLISESAAQNPISEITSQKNGGESISQGMSNAGVEQNSGAEDAARNPGVESAAQNLGGEGAAQNPSASESPNKAFASENLGADETAQNIISDATLQKCSGGAKAKRCAKQLRSKRLRWIVTVAMLVAAAMVLSYVEHLIPTFIPIPGVKLGLANTVTLFALYALGAKEAAGISFLRVGLSSLLFGNVVGLLYSASGALLSYLVMLLLKKVKAFSTVGVSVAGGVAHNVGQVLAAMAVMETAGLITYLAPLLISGVAAGAGIGIVAGILISKANPIMNKILK